MLMRACTARVTMRFALVAFVGVTLLAAGLIASTAFTAASNTTRVVVVQLVNDGAAVVAVKSTVGNPHSCFVSVDSVSGKMSISLGAAVGCAAGGAGAGVNSGSGTKYARYALHDLLTVTNQGQKSVRVWVNATSTTGTVDVFKAASQGTMTEAQYYASSATSLTVASTGSIYVGLRVNATTAVSGTIAIEARS